MCSADCIVGVASEKTSWSIVTVFKSFCIMINCLRVTPQHDHSMCTCKFECRLLSTARWIALLSCKASTGVCITKSLSQQLTHIAEEKEAAAAAERKRLTDRVKRRPERNRAFKVEALQA